MLYINLEPISVYKEELVAIVNKSKKKSYSESLKIFLEKIRKF
jgi:hypothetical protein